MNSASASSLVPWGSGHDEQLALVCIPWAGAGAGPFRSWAPIFDGRSALYGVRLAGRESRLREAPRLDVETIVREVSAELQALDADRLALFGHCSGALLAFELGRAIGDRLSALFVASQLPPREVAAAARNELESDGGLVERYLDVELRADPEFVELVRPILEADMKAIAGHTYTDGPVLDTPLTVFYGSDDPAVRPTNLEGWRAETTEPVEIVAVDGADHLFSGTAWTSLGNEIAIRLGSAIPAP